MHEAFAERRRTVQEEQRQDLLRLCVITREYLACLPKTFDAPSVQRLQTLLLDLEDALNPSVNLNRLKLARALVAKMGQPLLYLIAEVKRQLTDHMATMS